MHDRFKFRFFDKVSKEMCYPTEYNGKAEYLERRYDLADMFRFKDLIPMQCTGIKDVKGKLIYEGDILKVVNGSINGIGLSNKWEVKWVGNGWNIDQWTFDSTHSYEVIGNIYENKEFLKEGK